MSERKSQKTIKENRSFILKECQRKRNYFTETLIIKDRNYEYNEIERTKRKNKIIKRRIHFIICRKTIKLLIIINLFILSFPSNNYLLLKNNYSNITLKIKGSGYKGIFSSSQYLCIY